MQSLILSALLMGIVSAQSLAGLPACAYDCVKAGYPANCNLNAACICSSTTFIDSITCCVAKACDKSDQEATIKYAQSICTPAGVTNLPTAATCAANSSTSAVAATGSSTGSMSMTSMTSMSGSSMSSMSSSASSTGGSVIGVSSHISAASSAAASAATSAAGAGQMLAQGVNVFAAFVGAAALL